MQDGYAIYRNYNVLPPPKLDGFGDDDYKIFFVLFF